MAKNEKTETPPDDDSNGKLGQRDANKAAAEIAFKLLYNEGKEWPANLYTDADDKPLSDVDKVTMHKGYTNTLVMLATKAGIQVNKGTVTFG